MSPLTWKKNSIVLFCSLYRRFFLFGNFAEPKQNNYESKNRCVAALKQVKKCFHSEISNSSFFFRVPLFLQVWIHSTLTVTDTLTCWCSFPQIQAQSFRLYIYKNQVELKCILLLIATEYRNKTQRQTNFPLILYLVIQTEISSAQGLSMCQEGVESGCTGRNKQHNYRKQHQKEVLVEHLPNLSELQPLPSAGAAAAAIGTATLCCKLCLTFSRCPPYFPLSEPHPIDCSNERKDAHLHFGKCILHSERTTTKLSLNQAIWEERE